MPKKKTIAELQAELEASEKTEKNELIPGLLEMADRDRDQRGLPMEIVRKKKYKKPAKSKRSYMLREDTILKLDDIKRVHRNKSLSEVLTIAIDDLYDKEKQAILDSFNKD
jgi:hypothetical protein